MQSSSINLTRRRVIRILAATPVVALGLRALPAMAQAQQLAEDDPQAVALNYKHDASTVDAGKFPNVTAGGPGGTMQKCNNCQLIQGTDGEAWRPCPIFGGKLVAAEGWCSAYVPKAG